MPPWRHVAKRYSLTSFLGNRLLGETLCRGRSPSCVRRAGTLSGDQSDPLWGFIEAAIAASGATAAANSNT